MKIISLQAENFKRLVAVEITPTGNVVEIAGKNGQGKSSILDSIWTALAGSVVAPSQPIRKGQLEATITLQLGSDKPELIVTRTFRPKPDGSDTITKLTVESADGARFPSPQAVLDKLLGAMSFDPLEFERMDPRKQFNTLRAFVPGVDFDAIDADNKADYERRTKLNQQAKQSRAAADSIKVPADTPPQPVDMSALAKQLEDAGKFNADIETRKANRERMNAAADEALAGAIRQEERARELRAEAEKLEAATANNRAAANGVKQKIIDAGPLPEPKDTTEMRQQLANAEHINNAVRESARRSELLQQCRSFESAASELSLTMDKREVQKREAIAAAKLPVDGIEFSGNGILYNGVPFEQASDAERLTVSIAIAMAMNPKLRVVRVRDGSLLDDDSMKILADMADKNDCQVWIERVGDAGKTGIIIEDGRVK